MKIQRMECARVPTQRVVDLPARIAFAGDEARSSVPFRMIFPVVSVSAPKIASANAEGLRRTLWRWVHALRGALSSYVAHNDMAWERMADAQARDPNRH